MPKMSSEVGRQMSVSAIRKSFSDSCSDFTGGVKGLRGSAVFPCIFMSFSCVAETHRLCSAGSTGGYRKLVPENFTLFSDGGGLAVTGTLVITPKRACSAVSSVTGKLGF